MCISSSFCSSFSSSFSSSSLLLLIHFLFLSLSQFFFFSFSLIHFLLSFLLLIFSLPLFLLSFFLPSSLTLISIPLITFSFSPSLFYPSGDRQRGQYARLVKDVVERKVIKQVRAGVGITHWTQTLDYEFLNTYTIIYGQYPCYLWLGSNIAHYWVRAVRASQCEYEHPLGTAAVDSRGSR